MAKQSFGGSAVEVDSCVTRLAEFFPGAIPVRIPVRVSRGEGRGTSLAENTVIEFGTPSEVLFSSALALDFEDRVRIENSDGSLDTEAEIVAMQMYDGKIAVAARFLKNVTNWIIKQ